jgi:protein-disulfide isomerase/uncharacterized membrane protein
MAEEVSLKKLRVLVVVLGLVGFAISFEALRQHILHAHGFATGGSFCDISQYVSCNAVNASAWSTFLGIPIASYGIFFYLSVIGLCLLTGQGKAVSYRAMASLVMLGGAVSVVFSVALFALSLFVIKALCILCIGLYVVNVLLLASAWLMAFKGHCVEGLTEGVHNIFAFVRTAIVPFSSQGTIDSQNRWGTRFSLVALAVLAVCSWAVGPLMLRLFIAASEPGADTARESIMAWKGSPVVSFPVSLDGSASGDYSKGTPGAPIQIVEFADFECPGCRRMYFALNDLLQAYPGRYQLVFKNYPLDHRCNPGIKQEFHRYACAAAAFSRCAGEQGKFWESLDWLFSLPELEGGASMEDVQSVLMTKGTQDLELDPEGLRECIASERQTAKIQDDIAVADRLGLESTPSFWINGKRLPKATTEGFKMVFASILGAE